VEQGTQLWRYPGGVNLGRRLVKTIATALAAIVLSALFWSQPAEARCWWNGYRWHCSHHHYWHTRYYPSYYRPYYYAYYRPAYCFPFWPFCAY
jgi:hypothetical protein